MPGLSLKICFSFTSNTRDYSDCDVYDELDCYSDVNGGVDPPNYYAPTDIEFMTCQTTLMSAVCRRCRSASVSSASVSVNRGLGRPGRSPRSPGM